VFYDLSLKTNLRFSSISNSTGLLTPTLAGTSEKGSILGIVDHLREGLLLRWLREFEFAFAALSVIL